MSLYYPQTNRKKRKKKIYLIMAVAGLHIPATTSGVTKRNSSSLKLYAFLIRRVGISNGST